MSVFVQKKDFELITQLSSILIVRNYTFFSFGTQASSEHPLAKAIVTYARHFHFFDDSSTKDAQSHNQDSTISGWLFDVTEFSALPGRGVQCLIHGKQILVSLFYM